MNDSEATNLNELRPGFPSEHWILAHNPEVGVIYRCNRCRNIHLSLGPAHLQVVPETFLALVDLFLRGAANFELMLEAQEGGPSCEN
jgi:hypothetical protein